MDSKKETSNNSLPDFLKTEKIDDALKNVFRQELQIYIDHWLQFFPVVFEVLFLELWGHNH